MNRPFTGSSDPQVCIEVLRALRLRVERAWNTHIYAYRGQYEEERFLCFALRNIQFELVSEDPHAIAAREISDWIRDAVGTWGCNSRQTHSVDYWLRKRGIYFQSSEAMRDYRLAWIDHMLEYFRSQA